MEIIMIYCWELILSNHFSSITCFPLGCKWITPVCSEGIFFWVVKKMWFVRGLWTLKQIFSLFFFYACKFELKEQKCQSTPFYCFSLMTKEISPLQKCEVYLVSKSSTNFFSSSFRLLQRLILFQETISLFLASFVTLL